MKVKDIADLVHGEIAGDPSLEIRRLAKIEEAEPGTLTFLANPKYERFLGVTRASAVLISKKQSLQNVERPATAFIRVDDPYLSFVRVVAHLNPPVQPFPQTVNIAASAVVDPSAKLGENVIIGAGCVIAENVSIGDRTHLMPGVKIGASTVIGKDCVLYPNAVILHQIKIGDRVVLQSGCVIGVDGFGFARRADGTFEKFPQVGSVVIENDVEIGANTTIARSALGDTKICRGAKLDCIVHIGHHCTVGEDTALAAMVGFAGSSHTGKRCALGGQSGIAGHATIADDTTVVAQAGVTKNFTQPGITLMGFPARELDKAMRIISTSARAEVIVKRFREYHKDNLIQIESLKNRIAELESRLS